MKSLKMPIMVITILTMLVMLTGCGSLLLHMLDPDGRLSEMESPDKQPGQMEQAERADIDEQDDPTSEKAPQKVLPEASSGSDTGTSDDISFDHDGWPMIAQNVFGGSIQVGVPVTGVISEYMNFHQFTLVIDRGRSETFGLTLVITADSDEQFEIFFAEYYNDQPLIMSWNDFYEHSEHVEINGRTMIITYQAYEYPDGTFMWEFNCPEYQWGDGPDDPNPSDLRLHFSFLLDPDAERAESFE